MYLIRDKEAQHWRHHKTCPMFHCAGYLKCLCCRMFSGVTRHVYFWQASSFICGIHTHYTHQPMYAPTHKVRLWTHVSLCTKSLTVTARLLNDQCVHMKSYHWAVCSTDRGHVIFFLFQCLTFGVKSNGNVLISQIDFGGCLVWKRIALLLEKTSCFVKGIIHFWYYIEIFFSSYPKPNYFEVVTRSSLSIKTVRSEKCFVKLKSAA